jgi:hypothetical protein
MIRKLLMMATLPAVVTLCAGAVASPTIASFNSDGMTRVLASEAGHPFVLLVWSLDCTFCHTSMTNLAAAKNRGDFDVVAVAIESADEPGNTAAITTTTSKLGERTAIWAFGDQPPERLRFQIDPKWHGELPRSYWYDAKGQRIAAHSGLITPSLIIEVGKKIKGEPGPSK